MQLVKGSIRKKILVFVSVFVFLSLLGFTFSLFCISTINQHLDAINEVSIPLGKLFTQMQSDSEILYRELERRFGYSHWQDPHWRVKAIPKWIGTLVDQEIEKAEVFINRDLPWQNRETREDWKFWIQSLKKNNQILKDTTIKLFEALESKDETRGIQLYPKWIEDLENFKQKINSGISEYEKTIQQSFVSVENQVSDLKIALEIITAVVLLISLLILWFGEHALKPLSQLTMLAHEITKRGLKKEDKAILPKFFMSREDEVSHLSQEFHRMATALLEREKTVEAQKHRLEEQNRLLKEMGELSKLAAIGKMSAQVAHEIRNPLHSIGLEAEMAFDVANQLNNLTLKQSLQSILNAVDRLKKITENYLKFSKLSIGQKLKINIIEVFENVLASYAPLCEDQKIKIGWEVLNKTPLYIYGDNELMELVFGNLFKNALQVLEGLSEGQIFWKLFDLESGRICVQIEDSGPGISPDISDKLFQPFVTTRMQGTGLGLSFVKKVILEHGGTIELTKPRHLKGACFEILLPGYESVSTEVLHESTVSKNFISR
ncbi:MAG: hypothetical protein HY072_04830 [Deltaproteobacteria bacterium]|nr:hypothetical protein [Deltaproteobacteria bacterium]